MSDSKSKDNLKIVIVDYGMGNVRSVQCAISRLGAMATISDSVKDIVDCDGLILPGVGAFGQAMQNLKDRKLIEPLTQRVIGEQKPILGICLGMQLFAETSNEIGNHKGLGWLPGSVTQIDVGSARLSLPHVGWNTIDSRFDDQFFSRIDADAHFYFDHSFHIQTVNECVSSTTTYGNTLVASVRKGSLWGTQFHPEKSQTSGLKLLRNFLNFVRGSTEC